MKITQLLPIMAIATILYGGSVFAQSQDIYRTDSNLVNTIKVTKNGQELLTPWSGGSNNPQFAMADFNRDGKKDLVMFENFKGIRTYINVGTAGNAKYVYNPEYEYLFPPVFRYIKLIDYNCDQIEDLIHFGPSGVAIAKGYYNANNKLTFHPGKEIRYNDPTSGSSNVAISPADIPSIVDVDNDGDLDVLSFNYLIGIYVVWYKNMNKEDTLSCDSFRLKRYSPCWGRLAQFGPRTHTLGIHCNDGPKGSQEKTTDGQNALCLFDADSDGDYDMMDGNPMFSEPQFLKNGRVEHSWAVDSMVSQDTMWQGNGHKLVLPTGPAPFWLDIDQDGDNDFLFSPSAINTENKNNIAFYRNTGNDQYSYVSNNYLADQMLDMGTGSYPIFYDYNRDGKQDLLIGSWGYYQGPGVFRSRVTYLRNTSSGSNISFALETENFLNMDTMNFTGTALAIGDLDNDGLDELVIGQADGKLACYKNYAASAAAQPVWAPYMVPMKDANGTIIDAGNNATPLIYNINKTGGKDLIIGNQQGYLKYYRNTGTTSTPGQILLTKESDSLGKVFPSEPNYYAYSAPFIGKIDNTGTDYLLVGNKDGILYRYDGFQNGNVTTPYTLLDSFYSKIQVVGYYAAPAVADLDGDGKQEMIVGGEHGGLNIYRRIFDVSVEDVVKERAKLNIYPNPVKDILTITLTGQDIPANAQVRIYNSVGQQVQAAGSISNNTITLNVGTLPFGMYICTVGIDGRSYSGRFIHQQ